MMTHFFDNLWANEMVIDIEQLRQESFTHPTQVANNRAIAKQGKEYWERDRFLAVVGSDAQIILHDTPVEDSVKPVKKRTRVRRYEFTDTQLEIAFRSLNAGGSV
jgi:hypothetical protein